MSPNEKFAVALLNLAAPADLPLVKNARPDFEAIDRFHGFCSKGELMLVELAVSAWRGFGFAGAMAALDASMRIAVVGAIANAYMPLAVYAEPVQAVEPAPPAIPGQRSIHDQLAADAFMVDDHCELCGEPSSGCECDNCLECGKHFMRCTCETAEVSA